MPYRLAIALYIMPVSFTDFDDYTTSAHIIQGLFYFFAYFIRLTGGQCNTYSYSDSNTGCSAMLIPVPEQAAVQCLFRFHGRLQYGVYHGYGAGYSTILILVPRPVTEVISKCPLCLSTIHLAIERPSPVPYVLRASSAR